MQIRRLIIGLLFTLGITASVLAQSVPDRVKSIIVASTTSTQDSGLFEHLLPLFKTKTGIEVKIISQGTGQALDTGKRGDADVVLVHAREQEVKFVEDGFGLERKAVMYNDYVLIGPKTDPAGIRGSKNIVSALTSISQKQLPFVSRGDRSGTHTAELNLWALAKIDIKQAGGWYREIGQGMGAALNTSSAMSAYVLADRATWISFKNRNEMEVLVEDDSRLFNQYGVILVNSKKHPHIKATEGQHFIDWLISPEGQSAIARYKLNGQQLFFPNATQPGA